MARRRFRRREGLFELATRSDWRFAAGISATCVVAAAIVIPGMFAASPMLSPLAVMFTPIAWIMAFAFGSISLVRYLKQQSAQGGANSPQVLRNGPAPRSSATTACTPPTELDKVWATASSAAEPSPASRPESWSLDVLDRMEWKRFEDLCCAFYREKGIRAETTRLGADGGIDVHLFQDDTDPSRATAIVQCKAWSRPVGVKEIRELRGVMAHENAEKAFFMAPNGFTDDAHAFAAENSITLLDGKLILAMLQRLPDDASKRLLAFATEGDWTIPTCPSCGSKMADRDGKRGRFWGCSTFPKCNATLPMRAPRD